MFLQTVFQQPEPVQNVPTSSKSPPYATPLDPSSSSDSAPPTPDPTSAQTPDPNPATETATNSPLELLNEPANQSQFTCNIGKCRKQFLDERKLQSHIIKVHEGPNKYTCAECGHQNRTKKDHKSHLSVHRKDVYNCSSCDKVCKTKYHLDQHKDMDHTMFRPNCSKCSESFANKRELAAHIKCKHSRLPVPTGPTLPTTNATEPQPSIS